MEVIFLGTSSMIPTKERNHAGIFVRSALFGGILLDCGEGIQRQLRTAGISLTKVNMILLSHWHGDHVLGLPGLVQSIGSMSYQGRLRVFGPKGTKKRFELLKKALVFEESIDIEVIDISKKIFLDEKDYYLETLPLLHSTPCLGFAIVQKAKRRIKIDAVKRLGLPEGPLVGKLQEGHSVNFGGKKISPSDVSYIESEKRIAYISDTGICNNAIEVARNADLLICESTYSDGMEDKAQKYGHLTSTQAAMIASKANSEKLILTHFSQRYKTVEQIEESAKNVFNNVVCAYDFMKARI